jgi:hypothetical protein
MCVQESCFTLFIHMYFKTINITVKHLLHLIATCSAILLT